MASKQRKKSKAKKPKKKPARAQLRDALEGMPAAPVGRPSSYRPEYVEQAKALCERGATDREVAQFFSVAESTLNLWKLQHREFSESMKVGKDAADERVERSLYNRAVGYSFDSEKIMHYEGDIVRADCVEHVPPDVTAARLWLQNRRREQWGDKQTITPPIGPGLTVVIQQVIGNGPAQTVQLQRVAVQLPPPGST